MEYRERFLDPDYAILDGEKTRIEHIFYGNRNTIVPILKAVMFDALKRDEQCYIIYHVGDELKLFIMAHLSKNHKQYVVRLMQLTHGPDGVDIGEKIPKMDHTHLTPIITLTHDSESPNGVIVNAHKDELNRSEDALWLEEQFLECVVKEMLPRVDKAA